MALLAHIAAPIDAVMLLDYAIFCYAPLFLFNLLAWWTLNGMRMCQQ